MRPLKTPLATCKECLGTGGVLYACKHCGCLGDRPSPHQDAWVYCAMCAGDGVILVVCDCTDPLREEQDGD